MTLLMRIMRINCLRKWKHEHLPFYLFFGIFKPFESMGCVILVLGWKKKYNLLHTCGNADDHIRIRCLDISLTFGDGKKILVICRKLVESPYKESVDWSKWLIFWVDERVVPLDHEDSNYLLASRGFLSKVRSQFKIHFSGEITNFRLLM